MVAPRLTVAVTRPEVGALGAALEASGATVVHVPLIEVSAPVDGGASLRDVLGRLGEFDWLVVTSANGARAVGQAAAVHSGVRLAAVGDATARVFADLAGRGIDLVPDDQRATGLVGEFPADAGRVLVAQADRAGPSLVDGLRAKGAVVDAVTVYRTTLRRPSSDELSQLCAADVIVLASGSAAESLHAAVGVPSSARLVAIGPTTASAAGALGLTVTVAASPSVADVVAAVTATAAS